MIQFYVCMFAAIVHTRLFNNHVLFSKKILQSHPPNIISISHLFSTLSLKGRFPSLVSDRNSIVQSTIKLFTFVLEQITRVFFFSHFFAQVQF